jgi:hypothetical protein
MSGRNVHRGSTLLLSLLMMAIGLGLIIQAFGGGSGSISARLLLGALFLAAGVGRTYVEIRRGRGT